MTRGTGNSVRLSRHLTDTAGIGARASNETAKASFKSLFDSSIRPHDDVDPTDPASRTSAATNSRYVIPRATAFTFTLALAAQSRVEIIETRVQECSLVLVSKNPLPTVSGGPCPFLRDGLSSQWAPFSAPSRKRLRQRRAAKNSRNRATDSSPATPAVTSTR